MPSLRIEENGLINLPRASPPTREMSRTPPKPAALPSSAESSGNNRLPAAPSPRTSQTKKVDASKQSAQSKVVPSNGKVPANGKFPAAKTKSSEAEASQHAQSTITTDRKPAAKPRKPSPESDPGAEAKNQARVASEAPAVKLAPARGATVARMPAAASSQRPGAERNTDDGAASKNQARAAAKAPATRVPAAASKPDPEKEKSAAPVGRVSNGASNGNSNARRVQEPGAYSVQGATMARATTGVLSPQGGQTSGKHSEEETLAPPARAAATAAVTRAPPEQRVIAVAAELSSDVEAQIVEQIRLQFLQGAARADVVAVEHSTRSVNPDEEARRVAMVKDLHKHKSVREKLFGDARSIDSAVNISASPECIRKRDFLKWTVKRNRTTNMWVASVYTNQKALECNDTIELERTMRSYTATTQQEAFETGLAMAIPRMLPFDEHPICYVCRAKFALLRRPCHCRNCGVCVCSSCSTNWPVRMVPDTYNTKHESQVTVCLACDWLSGAFRKALADGRFKAIINLYATGNINVRNPFCNVRKEEIL